MKVKIILVGLAQVASVFAIGYSVFWGLVALALFTLVDYWIVSHKYVRMSTFDLRTIRIGIIALTISYFIFDWLRTGYTFPIILLLWVIGFHKVVELRTTFCLEEKG